MIAPADTIPTHVLHLLYRFSIGGLENVVVQLINGLPHDRFRHTVIALTDADPAFVARLARHDVEIIELHKPPGQPFKLYPRMFRLLRRLRPDVFHSLNLAALEFTPVAMVAGVPLRIHAEHGWDAHDPNGSNVRYQRIRRFYSLFVNHYIAVSQDLFLYLDRKIDIPARRRALIANGVDTESFKPRTAPISVAGCPFEPGHLWLVGTVGRMQTVKNQPALARGFVRFLQQHPAAAERARLVMIGDGPLKPEVERILETAGVSNLAWLPGARSDIADILRLLDCFVLPSEAEGTSCTLQEAMACGLPAIATAVGGTPQLVEEGATGLLVTPNADDELAAALWRYFNEPNVARAHGAAARQKALDRFALAGMIEHYDRLFSPLSATSRAYRRGSSDSAPSG